MKKKFEVIKKPCEYSITSINDPIVKLATLILADKVMRKCHANEIPMPVISFSAQCAEGMQFNLSCYLCSEFLANCHEAKDERKTIHYTWLLLSIMLVT